ncbi:MAG TPA: thiamine pyrophosphate-dependent enzyme [Acidobacteriota bacterium]|nr:thiamine pyrophosphate-dependent enzyme [Acidobacteriota bacterium]
MSVNRVQIVDQNFRTRVSQAPFERASLRPEDVLVRDTRLTVAAAVELLECQITSRWLDYVARELKAEGKSFYTIGSAGHEGNAMLGQITRPTDTAFLHYRSGGFYLARARQVAGQTPIFDTCLGLCASSQDPISGGRHKVWGSLELNIPPQTSTIASHLPKSVGYAFFMDRRRRLDLLDAGGIPRDAIAVCTFGDASVNHSAAQGALNAAAWADYQRLPVPLLLVCEDNGIGISVRTPGEWVDKSFRHRTGLPYFKVDALDIFAGYREIQQAVDYCRRTRRPVFLHLRTVRLLGHAGTDIELSYKKREEIEAQEALDPLIQTALGLIERGILSPEEVLKLYDTIAEQVRAAGREAAQRPRHDSAASVMSSLLPEVPRQMPSPVRASDKARRQHFRKSVPEKSRPRHMAQLINWGLQDLMLSDRRITVFGEDVARKGGVYNVTADLYEAFGVGRVFNTLLDEQAILGLAIGAGQLGLLPIAEIQYLAYLYNAIDQLRGEACSLQFFSQGQFRNPMVVRIASFAYQKGFGGHFHNDNGFASLREIPGIILLTASRGPDAVRAMRTAVSLARQCGAVVLFLEPIALYMTKDLVGEGDWLFPYPPPEETLDFGHVSHHGPGEAEILIIGYANGCYLSLQAQHDLQEEGIDCAILELHFLTPLNREAIVEAARGRQSVILVDESRRTGGLSEEIAALLAEELQDSMPHLTRICGQDTYIPLGTAWEHVLPSRRGIAEAVRRRWEVLHG